MTTPGGFCGECDAPRADDSDAFCRKCGAPYAASTLAVLGGVVAAPEIEAPAPEPRLRQSVEHAAIGVIIIQKVKGLSSSIGLGIVGMAFCALMLIIPIAILYGLGRLAEDIVPWLTFLSAILLFVSVFALIPLAFPKRTRSHAATGFLLSSVAYLLTLWFAGLLITLSTLGLFCTVVSLFFFGIGPIAIALISSLFSGNWVLFAELIFLIVLSLVSAMVGSFLKESSP